MQLFTASVTGTSNTAVTWGLSGAGCSGYSCGTLSTSSLSASAVYLAPSVAPSPASVNVIATSVVDPTKSASANVIIVPVVVVVVTPANVSATAGVTQQFAASVTGTSNTAVAWTVSGTGCSGTACGTISSNGLYTAPAAVPSPANVTITATSMSNPTQSAQANVTIVPPVGTTYYLATAAAGGNDSNNGLTPGAPWLTPNHSVNCGDVIIAAAVGGYSADNFLDGKWGTVTCSAGNNVAWLKCATFDGCKISALTSLQNGMEITKSYWGVQGWEVDGTSISGHCFLATPSGSSNIRNILFANDIAVGCGLAGFEAGNNALAGVDYFAVVGVIAYGTAGGSQSCGSGLIVYEPVASDSLPGTHIYVGGSFSWDNVDGNPCGGTAPTDGEGLIFDTFDGSQTRGLSPYTQQAVADNNILIHNGGRGFVVINNLVGSPNNAHVYVRNNTVWGNNTDLNQTAMCACVMGEIVGINFNLTEMYRNITVTNAATGVNSDALYDFWAPTPTAQDVIYKNVGWSATGTYVNKYDPGSVFSYGPNNLFGTNPSFANAVAPGAPSCGSSSSVPNCMATVIANFTPTNASAIGYGYQKPSTSQTYDPLFPQWLCNVNLPAGLVTMGCQTAQ